MTSHIADTAAAAAGSSLSARNRLAGAAGLKAAVA